MIEDIKDASGNVVSDIENKHENINVSDLTLSTVQTGMTLAADSYSGFSNLQYKVAAKTGTAQENANSPDHALCLGYAPAENPEISFSVNIQYGYKSSYAVRLSADVLDYYFGYITMDQIMQGDADGPYVEEEHETDDGGVAIEDMQNNPIVNFN